MAMRRHLGVVLAVGAWAAWTAIPCGAQSMRLRTAASRRRSDTRAVFGSAGTSAVRHHAVRLQARPSATEKFPVPRASRGQPTSDRPRPA